MGSWMPACAGMTVLLLLTAASFAADVYIGVSASNTQGPTFALGLPAFLSSRQGHPEDLVLGAHVRDVIRQDLLFSRRFKIVEAPSGEAAGAPKERGVEWRKAGAAFVLTAKTIDLSTRAVIVATLLDTGSGQTLLERSYLQTPSFWRAAAHQLADDVVRQLTGKPGIAHSQIAFINDSTGHKELYVADYDGEHARRLSEDRSIDLLPRWSPDRTRILYTSYKRGNPDLYEFDMTKGVQRVFFDKQGLDLAGGFSPDGTKLAMTLSMQKNPNIYLLELADGDLQHLTRHFGVDSSPTFSPDGDQIAFVSDRSGNPQVHILEISTGKTQRLTRLNWCDSPSWSPNGDWIVFSGRANARDPMDIFLVDVTGSQIRQLTHAEGTNEDPSWSPDGRFIAFSTTRDKRRRIYVMDADGSAPHPLVDVPGNSYTPSWSP